MARLLVAGVVAVGAALSVAVAPAGGGGGDGPPAGRGAEPAGRVLYVTGGNRLTSVDVASGRTTRRQVDVASCGPSVYVTGGHVVFAEIRKGRTIVYSIPVELDRAPRRLGSAHAFVPSAVDGRIWLAGTDCSRRRMVGVKEMTVEGKVTASSRRRVPGWLVGAVDDGLVLQRRRSVFAWDPASGRKVPQPNMNAVSGMQGNRLAGCTPGTRCSGLSIVDAASGDSVAVRVEPPYRLGGTAHFSPDASLLATPVVAKRRWAIAVGRADDGRLSIVPGSGTGRLYPHVAWSASSGWLFFRAGHGRVLAWRPGEPRAVALPFRLPRTAVNFMAG